MLRGGRDVKCSRFIWPLERWDIVAPFGMPPGVSAPFLRCEGPELLLVVSLSLDFVLCW
jgi:hypothetical protein